MAEINFMESCFRLVIGGVELLTDQPPTGLAIVWVSNLLMSNSIIIFKKCQEIFFRFFLKILMHCLKNIAKEFYPSLSVVNLLYFTFPVSILFTSFFILGSRRLIRVSPGHKLVLI